jgi:predicted transcriptional regulator
MHLDGKPWHHKHLREIKTVVYDNAAVGAELRRRREAVKASLRSVADTMGVSAPYISDLELGRRAWNEAKITAYEMALMKELTQQDYERLVAVMQNQRPPLDFLIGKHGRSLANNRGQTMAPHAPTQVEPS